MMSGTKSIESSKQGQKVYVARYPTVYCPLPSLDTQNIYIISPPYPSSPTESLESTGERSRYTSVCKKANPKSFDIA